MLKIWLIHHPHCMKSKALPLTHKQFLRRLDLGTLQLFVDCCRTGSLLMAAEQANLAVSSVSKRIRLLEESVQVSLLRRHARGVEPTSAGEAFLQHARGMIQAATQMHLEMLDYARGVTGRVRIAVSASVLQQYLPEQIASFAKVHPTVAIDVSESSSQDVIDAVRGHHAELGICAEIEDDQGLEREAYRKDPLVLLVPRQHPLARRKTIHFVEALDNEFIGMQGSSVIQSLMEKSAADAESALRQRIRVATVHSMCRLVEQGMGIGVMPEKTAKSLADAVLTRMIHLQDAWADQTLWIYARRLDALDESAKLFVNHVLLDTH